MGSGFLWTVLLHFPLCQTGRNSSDRKKYDVYLAGLGVVSVYGIYTEIHQFVRAEAMDKTEYVSMESCEHRHVYEQYMDAPHFPGNPSGSGEQKYPVWKSWVVEPREYDVLLCASGAASDHIWIDAVSSIPSLSDPL